MRVLRPCESLSELNLQSICPAEADSDDRKRWMLGGLQRSENSKTLDSTAKFLHPYRS